MKHDELTRWNMKESQVLTWWINKMEHEGIKRWNMNHHKIEHDELTSWINKMESLEGTT